MSKYYYQKSDSVFRKRVIKLLGSVMLLSGAAVASYIFFPLISWQIYFSPALASSLTTPIPKQEVLSASIVEGITRQAGNVLSGIDYTNAQNWFSHGPVRRGDPKVPSFSISIPKIKVENAKVSTTDTQLSNHLINYPGTAIPADEGNSVIFGHSTLPQLFDNKNYKTIFANLYLLKSGDVIIADVSGIKYTYRIVDISIVDAEDASIFNQDLSGSYLTLVTCTPPGTTWKRLIVKSKLEKI